MPRQRELFPESTEVRVADGHPRVWVRRVIIWARPGEVLQDVELRRGVNVVWSPDAGPAASAVGSRGGVGHGVGKSLFCRLIRYCLGEETFGTDALRRAVAMHRPEGRVGVELVVGGATWSVIRPIGGERNTWAADVPLDELAAGGNVATGIGAVVQAIETAVLGQRGPERFPGAQSSASRVWLTALAWMSRDQECRFRHLLDWRDTDAASRSPALGFSKDERIAAMRILLGAVSTQEFDESVAHREKSSRVTEDRKMLADVEDHLARRHTELARELGLEAANDTGQQVEVEALRRAAEDRLARLEADSGSIYDPKLAEELDEEVDRIDAVVEARRTARHNQKARLDVARRELDAVTAELANKRSEGKHARYGRACPICDVPIDRALAAGCGLSHVVPDAAKVAAEVEVLQEHVRSREAAVAEAATLFDVAAAAESAAQGEAAKTRARRIEAARSARSVWQEQRAGWASAKALVRDAERLAAMAADLPRRRAELEAASAEASVRTERLSSMRNQNAAATARWDELFRYVCRGLLGADAEAKLVIDGNGLHAELRTGGTAMDSLSAVALDLAALLMTVEGRAMLPGFLIHDSPREGDLGMSDYHRIFNFASMLEGLSDPPPLQYIVTTTTEPPTDLVKRGRVVLELSGSSDTERLLRCAL